MRLSAGNLSTSRFGLRGSEELGNGPKAVFTLENGFDLDTGKASQSYRLFGRQAFASLQYRYGTLTLGRHQALPYDLSARSTRCLSPRSIPRRRKTNGCPGAPTTRSSS